MMWLLAFAAIILFGSSATASLMEKVKSILTKIKNILIRDILVYSNYNLNFFTGFFKSIQEMMCFFIIFKDYEEYIYKNWSSIKCSTN